MKRSLFLFFCTASFLLYTSCNLVNDSSKDYTQYVNPHIGTAHCRWFHFTPGALPFGMAKPAPSTNAHLGNKWGWEATGYDYRDITIEGFPCLHEFQIGGIVLMPTVGALETLPGSVNDTSGKGYRSQFSHNNEFATAGYYSVLLDKYNIKAELTATKRVAFQRYTFPKSSESRILFDIGNRQGESGAVKDAKVTYIGGGRVEGWVTTIPEYVKKYQPGADVTLFFSALLDKEPSEFGAFNGDSIYPDKNEACGIGAGVYLGFNTSYSEKITVKVGLSYTSVENARINLDAEATDITFDDAKDSAKKIWNEYLGRIEVETSNNDDLVKFYTSLYHALLGRGLASDINGSYPKFDGTVGQIPLKNGKPIHNHYNTDAMWGAQWNLNQLWILAYPEHSSDFISSHLLVYKDSGWLADGIANSRYVSGVGTNMLSLLISAAYSCGIRDFDVDLAYEASLKNEIDGLNRPLGAGRVDTDRFTQYGYVPHQDSGIGPDESFLFSASHTLEYSFSCWAVAQWAKSLGKMDDYEKLISLSKGWERLYDPSTNFIRPKMVDGRFIDNFDPMQVWRGFQEGNAWQYTFYVPHDIESLVSKVGKENFNNRLDSIFTVSQANLFSGGTTIDAFSGLKTLYNHGNQPCLHISWLFNETGKPELSEKWVKAILNEFYGTDGIHGYGYGQDEDQGQLGAWYVMSSIGLFDIKGLTGETPSFSVGSPLFDKVTIKLSNKYYSGGKFVLELKSDSRNTALATRLPFKSVVKGGKLY